METVREEIRRAIAALEIPDDAVRELCDDDARRVLDDALRAFVLGDNPQWWWESFNRPGVWASFAEGNGYQRISELVPDPDEEIRFVVEEDALAFYPVYQTSPRIAQAVIAECYAFEYYLIAKDLGWLLCENHHNCLIAIGEKVEAKLRQYSV